MHALGNHIVIIIENKIYGARSINTSNKFIVSPTKYSRHKGIMSVGILEGVVKLSVLDQ